MTDKDPADVLAEKIMNEMDSCVWGEEDEKWIAAKIRAWGEEIKKEYVEKWALDLLNKAKSEGFALAREMAVKIANEKVWKAHGDDDCTAVPYDIQKMKMPEEK